MARLKDELMARDYQVAVWPTKHRGHAKELAELAKQQAELIVVVGGDGTIAEVVNGMAYSTVPLLIIPTGTENILANELRLRRVADCLHEALAHGGPKAMDLGRVNGQYFLAVLGVGFDAEVTHWVHLERSGHIDHLSYFWPIWRTFWGYRFPRLRVEADGQEVFDGSGLAFVGNIARYAMGLRILRDAVCDDGLLDLCIYPCRWQGSLMVHALNTVMRIHPEHHAVIYRRCRKVSIDAPPADSPPLRVEIDGDPGGGLPVRIEICPKALRLWMMPSQLPRA